MTAGAIIAPDASAPAREPRDRVALFTFAGSFMRATDGCHIRALQIVELLRAAGLRVIVYSFRDHDTWPWTETDQAAFRGRFPDARLVLEDGWGRIKKAARVKSLACIAGSSIRRGALRIHIRGLTPRLDAVRVEGIDLAIVSYAYGLALLNGRPAPRVIVDMHDVTSLERVQRNKPGHLDLGSLAMLQKELGYLSEADSVWSISYSDCWFLKEMLDAERVLFVPPVADASLARPRGNADFDLLFVGSNNRWNGPALVHFLDEMSRWSLRPTLAVAGNVCAAPEVTARASAMGNVTLLGFQPDLAALYARARAAICPVEGTGTKIKVVEALAAGKPVFAARGAKRGLAPGFEGCVFPLEEAAVASLLASPPRLLLAQAAAGAYAQAYAFDNVLAVIAEEVK